MKPLDITGQLKKRILDTAGPRSVADVRIGLGYTAVMLDNGQTGLAFTFHRDMPGKCSLFRTDLPLEGRSARDLLALIDSAEKIETAVGVATANALLNKPDDRFQNGDILDFINIRPTDRVGMVGLFGPLIGPIRNLAQELVIFEKEDHPAENLLPEDEIPLKLPDCQVALITATAIINRTLDHFLHAADACREVVILGASTPLSAEAFKGTPVTCLSGVIVRDPAAVLRIVSSAGGMQHFKKVVQKVNFRLT